MGRVKQKFKTYKLKNFMVSETKRGIKIHDKHSKWFTEYEENTQVCQMMKYLIDDGKMKELEDIIASIYYTSFNMATNAGLMQVVRDYFLTQYKQEEKPIDKVDDDKHLEVVKKDEKEKEEFDGTKTD